MIIKKEDGRIHADTTIIRYAKNSVTVDWLVYPFDDNGILTSLRDYPVVMQNGNVVSYKGESFSHDTKKNPFKNLLFPYAWQNFSIFFGLEEYSEFPIISTNNVNDYGYGPSTIEYDGDYPIRISNSEWNCIEIEYY